MHNPPFSGENSRERKLSIVANGASVFAIGAKVSRLFYVTSFGVLDCIPLPVAEVADCASEAIGRVLSLDKWHKF